MGLSVDSGGCRSARRVSRILFRYSIGTSSPRPDGDYMPSPELGSVLSALGTRTGYEMCSSYL